MIRHHYVETAFIKRIRFIDVVKLLYCRVGLLFVHRSYELKRTKI